MINTRRMGSSRVALLAHSLMLTRAIPELPKATDEAPELLSKEQVEVLSMRPVLGTRPNAARMTKKEKKRRKKERQQGRKDWHVIIDEGHI